MSNHPHKRNDAHRPAATADTAASTVHTNTNHVAVWTMNGVCRFGNTHTPLTQPQLFTSFNSINNKNMTKKQKTKNNKSGWRWFPFNGFSFTHSKNSAHLKIAHSFAAKIKAAHVISINISTNKEQIITPATLIWMCRDVSTDVVYRFCVIVARQSQHAFVRPWHRIALSIFSHGIATCQPYMYVDWSFSPG